MTTEDILAAATAAWPKTLKAAFDPAAREERKGDGIPEDKRRVHPSDPPHNWHLHAHGRTAPGPLPLLLDAPTPGVFREVWRGHFQLAQLTDAEAVRLGLAGQARHWVVEARRKHATAVAPGPVTIEGDTLYVEVTVCMRTPEAA